MTVTYRVGPHDGGFGYHVGDVWSETFPDHDTAYAAARSAAERQRVGGESVSVSYQRADGQWQTEDVSGGDRPATDVVDDLKDQPS
jgi:hypothetical protein